MAEVEEGSEEAGKVFRIAQLKAVAIILLSTSQLWNALLIFLAFLSFALLFPFYSYLVLPLAFVAFVVSWHSPILGTILSVVLIFPAVTVQSPAFFLLYLLILGLTFFEVFKNWYVISAVLAVVGAPFTPPPLDIILGSLIVPIFTFSALRLGSKKTAIFVPVAVFFILLLSLIWQAPTALFSVNMKEGTFSSAAEILRPKPELEPALVDAPPTFVNSLTGLFSQESLYVMNEGLAYAVSGTLELFFGDSALIQIAGWAIIFYLVAWLPLIFSGKLSQFLPSLSIVLLIPLYFISAYLSAIPPNFAIIPVVIATVAIAGLLDAWGIKITREEEIVSAEKAAKFIVGVTDLSTAPGPKSLADVGDYDVTKKEIYDAIMMPLKFKELTVAYKIKPPKGILLFGPPGCGKTLLMSALAKELKMGFYYVKCSEILSMWFGESERNVTELFRVAREHKPCVIFIDEIDAIGKRRDTYAMDEATSRVLSAILTEMDGMKGEEGVIMVGATNVPQLLDPALLRPGRFDKIIYMPPPDEEGRLGILKLYVKELPLAKDVDLKKIAKKAERFSGADLANLVLEAARIAAPEAIEKKKVIPIEMSDFLSVMETIKPSITFEMLEEYEKFRRDFERRVGREEIAPAFEERKITWEDVVGMDYIRDTLKEAIELPLLHEDLMKEFKVAPAKGILLFGPPGCGKTLIVKAAANELKATFIPLTPADFSRVGYDKAVKLMKDTFYRARENAPSVVFMDELESIAPSREYYKMKIAEEITSQLLQEMDGLKELKNVIIIGATNRPDIIDKALLRPGRFDKIVFVRPPNKEERESMLKLYLKGIKGEEEINYEEISEATEGFTGADISGVCQEAKLKLVRQKIAGIAEPKITTENLMEIISTRTPSVTVKMLEEYLRFVKEFGERK